MTYCVGLKIDRGIVFASDTRTNAGVDNIARFKKMKIWDNGSDRTLVLLSAGNLAVTQAVATLLDEQLAAREDGSQPTLYSVATMFQAARLVGAALRRVREIEGEELGATAESFSASFIMGGQIKGDEARLFQIYTEGNFIEAGPETPYFQIGEHKYGKPILDRVAVPTMRMGDAAKLVLLSFDSTLRSNLSVGLPIDIAIYRNDTYHIGEVERIEAEDDYFRDLSQAWSDALRRAFDEIKGYPDEN
ncbi:MAG TPA: peptidase [Devosiaceae bacterium]|nr:peptidase [Devosiaceae bacterium]